MINDPVMRRTLTTTLGPNKHMNVQICELVKILVKLLTIKYCVGFDQTLGKCTLLAFSKQNNSSELVATSKVNFLVTAPVNLKMPEQVRFNYAITPAIEIFQGKRRA
jgi:hypothetical protein